MTKTELKKKTKDELIEMVLEYERICTENEESKAKHWLSRVYLSDEIFNNIYLQRMNTLNKEISRYLDFFITESPDFNQACEIYKLVSDWALELSEISKLELKLTKLERGEV